jgi:hypothetical protein
MHSSPHQMVSQSAIVSLIRKVMQPYTFSDGTHIPAGNFVSVPSGPTHYDERFYDHPEKFDGFRFSNMNEEGSSSTKNQLVTTGPAFLPFGHGKVAWCVAFLLGSNQSFLNRNKQPRPLLRCSRDEVNTGSRACHVRCQIREWAEASRQALWSRLHS